jgi:alkanesulfonate monooxygenase SsuD/methylene tetrahydromethanopterin reductase-like flavin-dependent oxidoreductase (luciferase family)
VKLSVLDQSPIISGHSAARALAETLALAKRVEALGYNRYWLAEHHAIGALADPCPEILLARLGAELNRFASAPAACCCRTTARSRWRRSSACSKRCIPGASTSGSAERPEATRGPRAPSGGDGFRTPRIFRSRSGSSLRISTGRFPTTIRIAAFACNRKAARRPRIWLLGSSDYSGLLAAQLGVRFSFAHFINAHGGDAVMRAYKERFQPGRETQAHTLLCCFVICARTDEEAEQRARVVDLRRLEMAYNLDTPVPTLEQGACAQLHRAGARIHPPAARAARPRQSRALQGTAACARGTIFGRRADDHHDHRVVRDTAGIVRAARRGILNLISRRRHRWISDSKDAGR